MITVTFRTDEELKKQASKIYSDLGMNLSIALNLFMKQTVIQNGFPCSLNLEVVSNYKTTYPDGFFSLFGSGKDLDIEIEPDELMMDRDEIEL